MLTNAVNNLNRASPFSSYHALMPTGLGLVLFFLIVGAIMVGMISGITIPYKIAGSPIARLVFLLLILYFAVIDPNPSNFIIALFLAFIYLGAIVPGSLYVEKKENYAELTEVREEQEGGNAEIASPDQLYRGPMSTQPLVYGEEN